jgi:hypothetical protein
MGKKIKNFKGRARTQQRGKAMTQKQRWGVVQITQGEPKVKVLDQIPLNERIDE